MAETLVKKLKPYVTTFSAAVSSQYEHGDTITVGGMVTNIWNVAELLQDATDEAFKQEGVYITLDDGVGQNHVVLPYPMFLKKNITAGDIFLAEGRVCILDTTHTYEGARGKKVTVDKHKTETLRILAWDMIPLPKKEPRKVAEPKKVE